MSWGTQLQFKPSDKVLLNYSSFIGTDKPDSARLSRLFHNFFGIFTINDKVELTLGFDIGTEEKTPNANSKNTWYCPVGILRYSINNKWAIAGRAEYYYDKNEVIISTGTPNGFQTTGLSLNIDFAPVKNVLVRLEGRTFNSKDAIFKKGNLLSSNNSFVVSSIAVSL
jgi:hypothetical protein